MTYHALDNFSPIDEVTIEISRTRYVLRAVENNRDFTLVEILQREGSTNTFEILVVDVECDGVPPNNEYGIQYRERLALCISSDEKTLVEVWALRTDFPVLIHQNSTAPNMPVSLCLYFEPAASVLRSWTPELFLRRIQWWLEKSACGELHPADQPVEHLFFASKYELVLPWNLQELRDSNDYYFQIATREERPNGGLTCFLLPTPQGQERDKTTTHIEIEMPPIVHGHIEQHPTTLGELLDLFARRDAELHTKLRDSIQDRVDEYGVHQSQDDTSVVLILRIPMSRAENEQPDMITHHAFLIPTGPLALGHAIGALLLLDNIYYRDVANTAPNAESATQPIFPMQVLTQNDSAAARQQSGITDDGPAGVLIGAGSLGSALINFWTRNGWGNWLIVDHDHVKPHNLSRHTAYFGNVGESKALVVASLADAVNEGDVSVDSLVHDATDFGCDKFSEQILNRQLVIDASTTLEYPRAASSKDDLPRHMSVFITPNGNSAVLLAEDVARSHRLLTLEAQYYRAIITERWGHEHLAGNLRSFWSGTSCRDISMVMPYSQVMHHASTLADQIQHVSSQECSLIRIWHREPTIGSVEVHDVPTHSPQTLDFGDLTLHIDEGLIESLQRQRQHHLPNETGGALLGYYDFNVGVIVAVAALPPPPDSKSSPLSFERGTVGLVEMVQVASDLTSGVVGYIGEWHSHPPGSSASASQDDMKQLEYLAIKMAEDGLPAISLIVSENEIGIYQGEVV